MQSGLVDNLIPAALPCSTNGNAASRNDTISSLGIAVKEPPKKAISVSEPSARRNLSQVSLTSSGFMMLFSPDILF